jgi:hypothetical protein
MKEVEKLAEENDQSLGDAAVALDAYRNAKGITSLSKLIEHLKARRQA